MQNQAIQQKKLQSVYISDSVLKVSYDELKKWFEADSKSLSMYVMYDVKGYLWWEKYVTTYFGIHEKRIILSF